MCHKKAVLSESLMRLTKIAPTNGLNGREMEGEIGLSLFHESGKNDQVAHWFGSQKNKMLQNAVGQQIPPIGPPVPA